MICIVVMDIVFQPPQLKSYSVDMCMMCDNCNVKHFSINGKHYCEPCLKNSVFEQAPEILMLISYVLSPVVIIYSGSTDFSGFLYLDSSVISLKSAFTSTFFKTFRKICQMLFSTLCLFCLI